MSMTGRGRERQRLVRRTGIGAAVLVVLALLFLLSGHLLIGLILAVAGAAAVWVFLQARAVR